LLLGDRDKAQAALAGAERAAAQARDTLKRCRAVFGDERGVS